MSAAHHRCHFKPISNRQLRLLGLTIPGQVGRRCACGRLTLHADPRWTPAAAGPAIEVLRWIEARLPHDEVPVLAAPRPEQPSAEWLEAHPRIAGGGTITAAAGGGNWNATGTWTGGVVPVATDDVILASTSGSVVINTATCACRSLDCQGTGNYAGTLSSTTGSVLSIGTSTTNGSLALRFSTTMTWSPFSATSVALAFLSTSVTQTQITTAGRPMGAIQVGPNGGGGSWILMDTWVAPIAATSTVSLLSGTLNTNGQTITWGLFSSTNANTRTLTLGASNITLSGTGTVWNCTTVTNMTLNAGTSAITANGSTVTFNGGGLTYNNVSFTGALSATLNGANTFANLTRTGTATTTCTFVLASTLTQTITGTLTLTGNSLVNRLAAGSSATAFPVTLSAAVVSLTNVDLNDITAAGAATWTGTSLGNALGNTGITFSPVTRYWVGTTGGSWSSTANWATATGGATGASSPIPGDTAIFDANSITSGARTITIDMLRIATTVDFSAIANSPTLALSQNTTIYGNLKMGTMTVSGTFAIFLVGRSAQTLSTGAVTWGTQTLCPNTISGTYTLQDAIAGGSALTFQMSFGTFDPNGFNITCKNVVHNGGVLKLGAAVTWTLNGTGTVWNCTAGTVTTGSSTIVIADSSSTAKTFAGFGKTYDNLTVSAGPGQVSLTGANTFNVLTLPAGKPIVMPASTVTTFTSLVATGQNNGYLVLPGSSGNYASTPNAAPVQITGNMTIDVNVALNNWTSGGVQSLVAKWGSAGNLGYELYMGATGLLVFRISANGSTVLAFQASTTTGFVNGTQHWIRASFQLTNGSNSVVQFFTSSDGSTWSQLGTNVTQAIQSAFFNSTSVLEIGSDTAGTQSFSTGSFYRAKVYNSALGSSAGTPVFDADFTSKAFGANTFTESSANAATVSVNGTLAQAGDGRISIISSTPGTAATLSKASGVVRGDYLVLQDSTATGGAAFNAGAHSVLVSNNTGWSIVNLSNGGSDSLSFSDTASTTTNRARASSDSLAVSDAAGRTSGLVRPVTDALSFSDAASARMAAQSRASSDSLAVSDQASWMAHLVRAAVDAVAVSDTAARLLSLSGSGADAVTLTDDAVPLSLHARVAADALSVVDVALARGVLARAGFELVGVVDAAARSGGGAVGVADVVGVADAIAAALTGARSAADALSFAESVSARLWLAATAGDAYLVTDAAQGAWGGARGALDLWSVSDSARRVDPIRAAAVDSWTVRDVLVVRIGAVDVVIVSDAVSQFLRPLPRPVSDELGVSGLPARRGVVILSPRPGLAGGLPVRRGVTSRTPPRGVG